MFRETLSADLTPLMAAAAPIPPVDHARAQAAVRELLFAIGEDPAREGLIETPARVAKAFAEMTQGLREDAAKHLSKVFHEEDRELGSGLVVVKDIPFHSLCEHHLLPVIGTAHVAYLPSHGRVVGLSKLARTVEVFAKRPQVQERMTAQIADAIHEHLEPRGVCVVVEAEHFCMTLRGVKKPGTTTITSALRGCLIGRVQEYPELAQVYRGRSG